MGKDARLRPIALAFGCCVMADCTTSLFAGSCAP
jgi:hypothetical protein